MKRILQSVLLGAFVAFTGAGCTDFVQGIDDPIDQTADPNLTSESEIAFLVTGVKQRFSNAYDQTTVMAEGHSDAFVFGGSNATFPTYRQADQCEYLLDNNSSTNALSPLGQFAFLADNLVERVADIGTFEDEDNREAALYNAHLYGGLARYMYATYFGLEATRGGGFDETGTEGAPFVESDELYQIALGRWQTALDHASSSEARLVNSLRARALLYSGSYGEALAAAEAGLDADDSPMLARYTSETQNDWYSAAGLGRSQFIPAARILSYVEDEPAEAARVRLLNRGSYTIQNEYPTNDASIVVIDWQENFLIAAEAAIRTGQSAVTIGGTDYSPLELVNEVRGSHDLEPLEEVDLGVLYAERDKELFARGQRLVDNRRFQDFDHCDGAWRYLPITERERNANPNV